MAHEPVHVPVERAEATWVAARCARCGESFRCGADAPSCWCDALTLSDEQRERLGALRLEGCLCRHCLGSL